MFSQDQLYLDVSNQLGREPEHDVSMATSEVDVGSSYNYLKCENIEEAVSPQYIQEDDGASSIVPDMQVEQMEGSNMSVEEPVKVLYLGDTGKDSEWLGVNNNVSRDGTNAQDDGQVISVSVNKDNHHMIPQDMIGAAVTGKTGEMKEKAEETDDCFSGDKSTFQTSSTVVTNNKGYYCSKCKKYFEQKRQFLNHLQLHFKSKNFECTECGERFYQRHCLELHRVTHLDVRKVKPAVNKQLLFECKMCCTRFSSICMLKNHISALHRRTNQNGNAGLNLPTLETTVAMVRPETGHHICYHCQNTFHNKKTFSKHIKIHSQNFECIACPKSFGSKEELGNHNWTHFSFYSCSVCESVFKSSKELTRHEGLCLSHLLSNKDLVDIVGSDKLFVCDVCSDVFVKKQDFHKHLQRHVKQFRCKQCGSGYHSQTALENHEKFHEFNSHMYKCSDCPESFYSLHLLQIHQKTHAAESRQCSICKEVFKSEEQRHKHKHLFLGNVKCDLCSIQCSGSHGLNMHKRLAHPETHHTNFLSRMPKKSSEQIIVCIGDDVE